MQHKHLKKKWYSERRRKHIVNPTVVPKIAVKKKWYSERRRKLSFSLLNKSFLLLRRNDTLRGDGNLFSIPFVVCSPSQFKKKWYSERRRKPTILFIIYVFSYRYLRRNDTLRGDGNFSSQQQMFQFFRLRRNDTLRGDGNILCFTS